MFIDLIERDKKIFLWLSEETQEEYLGELSRTGFDFDLGKIHILSEMDTTISSLESLKLYIIEHNIDFLFLDNLTTSGWYGEDIKSQTSKTEELMRFVKDTGVSLITFAHTDSKVSENHHSMISMYDIRGSRKIINCSHFIYIMQNVFVDTERYQFMSIAKSRTQSVVQKIFRMIYAPKSRVFAGDKPVSFEDFKGLFAKRNRL